MTTPPEDEFTQTQPLEARTAASVAPWARIRIVSPPEATMTLELRDAQSRVLGRGPTEDGAVKIPHRTVSRSHVSLAFDPPTRTWTASDLGSRNGTWVDGVKLGRTPVVVADGSVVRIGDVLAVFEWVTGGLSDSDVVRRDAIFGDSARAIALRADIERIGPDPASVLVIGDTGTGKELSASELHRLSGRPGPLVTFNCAELSATVVESQLFGHEKGAFTGATTAHPGLFRSAHGGTLFLDEVGEIPLGLQAKLLRVLQTGEVLPLGGTKRTRVDVRIVAATNRNLNDEVVRGSFRRDLYARLAIHELRVPSIRRRCSDILGWLDILGAAWAALRDRPTPQFTFSADAAELLVRAPWEDNLRGLDRLVHVIAPMAAGGPIVPEQLPAWVMESHRPASTVAPGPAPAPSKVAGAATRPPIPSREELLAALEANAWVIQAVARHYARDRRQIYRWMDNHSISRRD